MTIEELREKLAALKREQDDSQGRMANYTHSDADDLLLEYINDKEVTDLFNSLERWYE